MGRKIDMRKIDDVTKCQVTFSKRRSSLMKKANEIAVCCDVDVAFVAFSPSGRISKFCNQRRIEDVLRRYVNLPVETRLSNIGNLQSKTEKLRALDHIMGEMSKLQYLNKQIENLELQIKKSSLQLQILETDLRDYEPDPDQEPSLHQLSWCERNINNSLWKVLARKGVLFGNSSTSVAQPSTMLDRTELANQDYVPISSNFNDKEVSLTTQNASTGQILMHLDPWISPYSARVRESIFQNLLDHTKILPNTNYGTSAVPNLPLSNIISTPYSPVILDSGIAATSDAQQQPLTGDQTLLTFLEQNKVNDWNNFSSVSFPNSVHDFAPGSSTIQSPRYTSTTIVTANANGVDGRQCDNMTHLQYANLNLGQVSNTKGFSVDQTGIDHGKNLNNDNVVGEDALKVGCDNMNTINQSEPPNQVHTQEEAHPHAFFDTAQQEDTFGENASWTSRIQKSNLWEWDDLLLDENFNFADHTRGSKL